MDTRQELERRLNYLYELKRSPYCYERAERVDVNREILDVQRRLRNLNRPPVQLSFTGWEVQFSELNCNATAS